jgi:leucyl-tRNA---protein transferase
VVDRTLSFTTPPSPCEYLPDRLWRLHYEVRRDLSSTDYMARLLSGWRRFGYATFRPECPSCSMCQSLRVPVTTFHATGSQRRVWNRNRDVTLRIAAPAISPERLALWKAFHEHGEAAKGWPEAAATPDMMLHTPLPIEEWTYYCGERLIGVGYVDALPQGLSAIYFYWDPEERHRSLGTFNILSVLAAARERYLPHVYLGYHVEGCRSLEYKARFGPSEVLRGGEWSTLRDPGGQ